MNNLEIVNLVIYIVLAVIIFAFFFLAVKVWLESESGLIFLGRYDEEIKQKKVKKEHKVWKFIRNILSGIILGGFITIAIGLFVTTTIKESINYIGIAPISILSGSMSEKNHLNDYLEENDLNNQFNKGDLIFLEKLPEQDDLELYDVIGYFNSDGELVVHRIIGGGYYDEQNVFHYVDNLDDAENYIMRGDANNNSDSTYITYDEMYGIYEGGKIPYLGFFSQYLQSGFGVVSLCGVAGIIFSYEYFIDKYNKTYNKRKEKLVNEEANDSPISPNTPNGEEVESTDTKVELLTEPDYLQIDNSLNEDNQENLEKENSPEESSEAIENSQDVTIEEFQGGVEEERNDDLNNKSEEIPSDEDLDLSDIEVENVGFNEEEIKAEKMEEKDKKENINKDEYLNGERNEKDIRSTVKRLNK